MSWSRVTSVLSWCRSHPSAGTALGLGALAMLFSPGPTFAWVVVLVGGAVVLAAATVDHGTPPSDGPPVVVPQQRRPDDTAVQGSWLTLPVEGSEPTEPQLRALTDDELCRVWRASYVRLQRLKRHPAGTRSAVVAMAAQRARYLDEIERRHPAGFAAWLAAGARAPSDPTRYLHRPAPRGSGDDASP